jgi:hypothetical protein
MGKILKLPIVINKNNGQITSYIKNKQLPKDILESIRKQPTSCRRLLMEFRGVEND